MRRVPLLFALLSFAAPPAPAATPAVDRLASAVADHPDDPDLSFAYARALFDAGQRDEAAARLTRHLRRWPEQPVRGPRLLGRWLYELGRYEDAVAVLERALATHPDSASARLTLGLALKRVGRLPEAERQFQMAAALEDTLAAEALLLAGLARLELGDETGGQSLLQRVIALDPDDEAARSARLVLEGVSRPAPGWLQLEAYAGTEYDSNVTLESNELDFAAGGSDESDLRFNVGTQARVRAFSGERSAVELGGRYDGGLHLDLEEYDTHRFTGFLSGRYSVSRGVAFRVDAWGGETRLDSSSYLTSATLRPSVFATLGDRLGVLRAFAEGEWLDYAEPSLEAFERSGFAYGGGLEHYLPFHIGEERSWLSIGASYRRHDTDAERDALLGFSGDYDHDRWRAGIRSQLALPWQLRAVAELGFDAELYANDNLTGFLTELRSEEREDTIWTTAITLTRHLGRFVEVDLAWRFSDRSSNVALFAYDRHVVGVSFRAHTP